MPTRYEVELYRDVERIRKAAERRADIETCRYLNEVLEVEDDGERREALMRQLEEAENRVTGGPR